MERKSKLFTHGAHALLTSAFVILLMLAVVSYFGSRIFSDGGDLGWHYGLADFIAQHGTIPGAADQYLQAMLNYPPASHIIAATIGLLLGSTLQAIFLTAAIYALGIYVVLGLLMQRAAKNEFAAAALVSIVLISGASVTPQLSGNEIILNFFYAQLTGDFIMLVAFALLTAWTPRSRFIWLLSATAAVAVVETFYVLSAVRLALALVLFQMALVWRSGDRNIKIQAAFVLLLPAVVPLHPAFMSMVQNSAHDGGISVSLPLTLLSVALLLVITLPAWIEQARSDKTHGDFALNCLGLGVALSAVVQIAAFFALGLGSPYAIKKHAFLVGTLLVTIAALRTIRLTPLRGAVGRLNGGRLLSAAAAASAFATIAVLLIFPWHSKPLAPFLRYDLEVRALVNGSSDLQGSTISANKDFPNFLNLATSIAVLKMNAWSPLGPELFRVFDGPRTDTEPYASRFILIRAADTVDRSYPDCQFGRQLASVKVISSACFYRADAARKSSDVRPVHPSREHLDHDKSEAVFRHGCKLGLEGIVSKRRDSSYRSGRSSDCGSR
jgi:hypothetical protein